jgi:hypothetical protein
MALLLLLAYGAVCVVIFKILHVKVSKWSITSAGIGGIMIVGGLLLAMNYNHPFTTDARLYFYTTPIVPEVKGRVVDVPVKPNVALKQATSSSRSIPGPTNTSSIRRKRRSPRRSRTSKS